ncbi:hypothetical protein EDE15_4033 [Edaphobacter aggregans]|uniref:Uncharacterized protein n=1 Tax=Edaphobacter aggregans TaxID=570835 RepID=A0A3R9QD58_9BACT|nr:hypothetical protein [Edaphobacter aggregans]RSL18459.1 hypothetical protein EDE15_4033 [Edaphobacter aggregans]
MKFAKTVIMFALALSTASAFASDHAASYMAGTFSATNKVNDGTYSNGLGRGIVTQTAAHNVHYVSTSDGTYAIESPTAVGKTILVESLTHTAMADIHKQWFMDQLREGDQILFAAQCDKHNNCTFWLPNPDKVGKEIKTQGQYQPNVAQTNTTALCGKGKFSPAVEAQVCQK